MSGGNYMFMMVAGGEVDMPIYEAEFINTQRVRRPCAQRQRRFFSAHSGASAERHDGCSLAA